VLTGVFVTAFYTFRMIFLTFHGKERLDHHAQEHFHDVGWDMKGPLVALAIPSLLIGYFTIEKGLFGGFFAGAIKVLEKNDVLGELKEHFHGPAQFALHSPFGLPLYLAAGGVGAAWYLVLQRPDIATAIGARLSPLVTMLNNKYYFDWFNENVLAKASRGLGSLLWGVGDKAIIDGALVNGSALGIGWVAGVARRIQTGFLYSYAFWMVIGLALMLGWFLLGVR
jgi:NADH-quinone oxidoreductase subunit L